MAEEKDLQPREPVETGVEPVQQHGSAQVITPTVLPAGRIEGHPLPEVLSRLAPAFRSHPFFVIALEWVAYTTKELKDCKEELAKVRAQLESVLHELGQKREEIVGLTEQIKSLKEVSSLKRFMQIIGGLLVGASYSFYHQQQSLFAPVVIALLGLALIAIAFLDRDVGGK